MSLELVVDAEVDLPILVRTRVQAEVARMARAAARMDERADYEVVLRLTSDRAIRELNREYRSKNKPTDVLAFAQREGPAGALHPDLLGDIVISVETARRQAKRGLAAELLHLASHGLCHLLGYNHRTDEEERAMNARAKALRDEGARRGRIKPA